MNPRSLPSKSTADMMAKILKYFILWCLLPTTYYLLCYAYPPGWSDDILLTPEDNKNRGQCDLDVDGLNNVWAVWDSATWIAGTAEVLFTKRDSLGGCTIPETPVSNNPTFSTGPRLAIDTSNNAQFIWRDWSPQGDGVWHAKLANDGSTLVSSHLAVSGAGGGESTLLPEMVINKHNELYIIWDESPSGYNQMNFTKLNSLGNPIIGKIRVSLPGVYAYWPGIGVDSFANAHMAYRSDSGVSDRLTYSKLDRNGNVLISNIFLGIGCSPTLIADRSQFIHVVYPDPAGPGTRVKYLKLDQSGNIVIGPIILSVHESNYTPHMAMDSLQYLHVVWAFISGDSSGLMYTKIDTLGSVAISPMVVVAPPYCVYPFDPRIAVGPNNRLHLVWKDQRLNAEDIFYKRGENEPGIEETNQSLALKPLDITVTPNPFRHGTKIRYSILDTRYMTCKNVLEIYDASGRFVKGFDIESSTEHQESAVLWDGKDFLGHSLPDGIYFLRLSVGDYNTTEKLLLIR
jgi:hypothetical protein